MQRFLTVSAMLLAAGTSVAAPTLFVGQVRVQEGDDARWSAPDFDDSSWEVLDFHDVPGADSIVWMRAELTLEDRHFADGEHLALYYAGLSSHEVYWDGTLLGRGGVVGRSAEREVPGPIQALHLIPPDRSTVGRHVLAIRTSAFHRHFKPSTGHWGLMIGNYRLLARGDTLHASFAMVSVSGLVLFGFFALMMFAQNTRDRSFLYLGLLCVSAVLMLIAESVRSWVAYPYNYHLLRLLLVTTFAWCVQVFLLLFLARRFPMRGAWIFVGVGVVVASLPIFLSQGWDPKVVLGFAGVLPLALAWAGLAAVRRRRGAIPAAVGLAICTTVLFWNPYRFPDRHLYPSVNLLLGFLLVTHVTQIRRERGEREGALLKSARLENELLKKHIQPHFLLNTLTALSEWIEQEPQVASKMIQSLADEFRMLSSIAHRRLITMQEEIDLCRTHLDIMSRRKGCDYRLIVTGVDTAAEVPPAIIHTLVENAITHNEYAPGTVEFTLSGRQTGSTQSYRFTAPLARETSAGAAAIVDGTGLRYIKARLEESFGNGWQLLNGRDGNVWCSEIVLPVRG